MFWRFRPSEYKNSSISLTLLENCTLPSAWDFAECFLSGHSAKQYFAECRTRQSNILPSAALGKIKHSAKVALPSARHSAKPGSRQSWALPSAAALGKSPTRQKVAGPWRRPPAVRFCRVPNRWHSAIFFLFLKTYFAECQPQALGNFFYFLKT